MSVDHEHDGRDARRLSAAQAARLVVGVVLLVAVVAVVVDNRQKTRVGYVFGDVRAPLIVVLLATAVAGALIGWLFLHRPHHERSRSRGTSP